MPGGHGKIEVWEDFTAQTYANGIAIHDSTLVWLQTGAGLGATSGTVTATSKLTLPNGVMTFSGAGGAADGFNINAAPMKPSTQGPIVVQARFALSALTTWQCFIGFASTVVIAEAVQPFTLSGTTLTANNAGNCFGLYYDTTATTDDWRTMASVSGVAATTALNQAGTALGALGQRANSTPVADSFMYLRVEIDPDGAGRTYLSDVSIDVPNTGPALVGSIRAGTLSTTALYTPVLMCADPSTTDPDWNVDFFGATGYRDWAF